MLLYLLDEQTKEPISEEPVYCPSLPTKFFLYKEEVYSVFSLIPILYDSSIKSILQQEQAKVSKGDLERKDLSPTHIVICRHFPKYFESFGKSTQVIDAETRSNGATGYLSQFKGSPKT